MPRKRSVEIPIRAKNLAKKAFKAVGTDVEVLGKQVQQFNAIGAKIKNVGSQISQAGRQITLFAGIAAAAIGGVSREAANFETNMARVATLIGGDVTRTIEQFGPDVRRIAIQTSTGTQEVAAGLFDIISAGVPAAKAIKVLEVAAVGARGGFTDVRTAAGGILAIMNSYNMASEDALRIAELFALANEKGITTFGALGNSIGRVASTAANFGVKAEELIGGVAAITATSKKSTDEAVTGIRALITAITGATDDQKEWLDTMQAGVPAAERLELSIAGLQKVGLLEWLNRAIKLTGGNATALDMLIGQNVRAKAALFDLVAGQDKFNETVGLMIKEGPKGVRTIRNFEGVAQTAEFVWKQLRLQIRDLAIDLGHAFLPTLVEVFRKVKPVVASITDWIKRNRALVGVLAKVAIGGTALLAVAGPVLVVLGGIVTAIVSIVAAGPVLVIILKGLAAIAAAVATLKIVHEVGKRLADSFDLLDTRFGRIVKKVFIFGLYSIPILGQIIAGIRAMLKLLGTLGKKIMPDVAVGVEGKPMKDLAAQLRTAAEELEKGMTKTHTKGEDARTKATLDAIQKRLAAFKKAAKETKSRGADLLELSREQWERLRGRYWLNQAELNDILAGSGGRGFATDTIVRSLTTGKKVQGAGGQVVQIDQLVLPDVTDTEQFASSLFDFTQANNFGFAAAEAGVSAISGVPARNTGGAGGSF